MTDVFLIHGKDGRAASRAALSAALDLRSIPEQTKLAKNDAGMPFLPDYPDIRISLSHTDGYGACAVSNAPVGVDVERHRAISRRVRERCFTAEEQDSLSQASETAAIRLWTRKEAFVKALGVGLTLNLCSFSVTEDTLLWEKTIWNLITRPLQDGFLTVCSRDESVQFHFL